MYICVLFCALRFVTVSLLLCYQCYQCYRMFLFSCVFRMRFCVFSAASVSNSELTSWTERRFTLGHIIDKQNSDPQRREIRTHSRRRCSLRSNIQRHNLERTMGMALKRNDMHSKPIASTNTSKTLQKHAKNTKHYETR